MSKMQFKKGIQLAEWEERAMKETVSWLLTRREGAPSGAAAFIANN